MKSINFISKMMNWVKKDQVKHLPSIISGKRTDNGPITDRQRTDHSFIAFQPLRYIAAIAMMVVLSIGEVWGDTNTITAYNNDSVKSNLWFSIAASPVVSSITGSGSGSDAKAAKNSSGTQITVRSIASGSNVYTMTFGLKSGITVTGVALELGDDKLSYIDIKIGSSTFTGSKKDWSLSGLSLTSSFSITFNDTEATGSSNRNTKIKSITFTYTTSFNFAPA